MKDYYLLDSDDERVYRIYHKNRGEKSIPKAGLSKETMGMIDGLPKLSTGASQESLEDILREQEEKKRDKSQSEKLVGDLSYTPVTPSDREAIEQYKDKQPYAERAGQIDRLLKDESYYPQGSPQRKKLEEERSTYASAPIDWRQNRLDVLLSNPKAYNISPEKEAELREQRYGVSFSPETFVDREPTKEPATTGAETTKATTATGTQQQTQPVSELDKEQKIFSDKINRFESYQLEHMNSIRKLDQEIRDRENQQAQLEKDYLDNKINPSRIWGDPTSAGSWMARAGAAFAVALSGFGGGLLGMQGNSAIDAINKQIDFDIEAQKANMEKSKNLLSMHMQRTGNMRDAVRSLRADLLGLYGAQLQLMQAKTSNKETYLRQEQLKGEIKLQQQKINQQEHIAKADRLAAMGQLTEEAFADLPPEAQKLYVSAPTTVEVGGIPTQKNMRFKAGSEQSAEKAKESIAAYNELEGISKQYESLLKNGYALPLDSARYESERLKSQTILALKNLIGAVSASDMKNVDALLPDVTAFRSGVRGASMEGFNKYIRNAMESKMKAYLINYKEQPTNQDQELAWIRQKERQPNLSPEDRRILQSAKQKRGIK